MVTRYYQSLLKWMEISTILATTINTWLGNRYVCKSRHKWDHCYYTFSLKQLFEALQWLYHQILIFVLIVQANLSISDTQLRCTWHIFGHPPEELIRAKNWNLVSSIPFCGARECPFFLFSYTFLFFHTFTLFSISNLYIHSIIK